MKSLLFEIGYWGFVFPIVLVVALAACLVGFLKNGWFNEHENELYGSDI